MGNLTRNAGAVLAIIPADGSLGSGKQISFANGNSLLTNGILPTWVVARVSGSNNATDFVTHGATGVTVATYSAHDLTNSTNSDVVNQAAGVSLSTDAAAYALKTNQAIDLGGHTLTLGNGSGNSGLILNDGAAITNGNITAGNT